MNLQHEYEEFSKNATEILQGRYYNKGETIPQQVFRRTAHCVAGAEKKELRQYWEEEFFNLMIKKYFMPNSPTLMNAGTDIEVYSACFVAPIDDNIESIYDSIKQSAIISKSGGGVGFSFDRIRPKGMKVGSTNGVASGPISWLKIHNISTGEIKQGGKRRGANMGGLIVTHPDIEEFIECKKINDLSNFNISVVVTNEFMNAVIEDKEFTLEFGDIKKIIRAKELFDKIIKNAWFNGDPGLIFIDRINADNPTPHIGKFEITNPCGEQPLLPYEACNLGSISLSRMYNKKTNDIDWELLENTVRTSIRFLDNIIDISKFPLPEIDNMVRGNRKIGLGIMGWADLLYKLMIPYNSEKALILASNTMNFIRRVANDESYKLGNEKGVYPNCRKEDKQRRNATTTTIAPTGTIAIIVDDSGGIEPNFSLYFQRYSESMGITLDIVPEPFKNWLQENNLYNDKILEKIINNNGKISGLNEFPKNIQEIFITASEISPEWHIKMQAAFQNNGVENAVSKTINMPNNATIEDVKNAYLLAWKLGCKGITIYRDGSKENQPLSSGKKESQSEIKTEQKFHFPDALSEVYGVYRKYKTGCGSIKLFLGVNSKGELTEIRTETSSGGCHANIETLSRLTSKCLGMGVDHEDIKDQLKSAYCKSSSDKVGCRSCGHVIAKAIEEFDNQEINIIPVGKNEDPKITGQLNIPVEKTIEFSEIKECKHPRMIRQEGCQICPDCGAGKCS